MRRAIWILLGSVTFIAVLFVFVLPARTLLAQRRSLSATESQIRVLSQENAKLSQRVAQLQSTAEIEQIARQEYGLVMPGEQAYVILPPKAAAKPTGPSGSGPANASPAPSGAAGAAVAQPTGTHHGSFWGRLEFWK